jgi:hypothetical protein
MFAPPSFALNPLVGFRAKDGVLRSSVGGAAEDGFFGFKKATPLLNGTSSEPGTNQKGSS